MVRVTAMPRPPMVEFRPLNVRHAVVDRPTYRPATSRADQERQDTARRLPMNGVQHVENFWQKGGADGGVRTTRG
jgi:hypothetical protein